MISIKDALKNSSINELQETLATRKLEASISWWGNRCVTDTKTGEQVKIDQVASRVLSEWENLDRLDPLVEGLDPLQRNNLGKLLDKTHQLYQSSDEVLKVTWIYKYIVAALDWFSSKKIEVQETKTGLKTIGNPRVVIQSDYHREKLRKALLVFKFDHAHDFYDTDDAEGRIIVRNEVKFYRVTWEKLEESARILKNEPLGTPPDEPEEEIFYDANP